MKTFKIVLATVFTLVSVSLLAQEKGKSKAQKQKTVQQPKENEGRKFYVCPMHADVVADQPGKCTKCGMDLTVSENGKGKAHGKDKRPANYLCPMHPEVTSEKAGKCSKCGMDLVKNKKDKGGKEKNNKQHSYVCPMHADVVSSQAGKCSKCGMDLTENKEHHGKKHN